MCSGFEVWSWNVTRSWSALISSGFWFESDSPAVWTQLWVKSSVWRRPVASSVTGWSWIFTARFECLAMINELVGTKKTTLAFFYLSCLKTSENGTVVFTLSTLCLYFQLPSSPLPLSSPQPPPRPSSHLAAAPTRGCAPAAQIW